MAQQVADGAHLKLFSLLPLFKVTHLPIKLPLSQLPTRHQLCHLTLHQMQLCPLPPPPSLLHPLPLAQEDTLTTLPTQMPLLLTDQLHRTSRHLTQCLPLHRTRPRAASINDLLRLLLLPPLLLPLRPSSRLFHPHRSPPHLTRVDQW